MADLVKYEGESVRAGLNGVALMVEYQLFARWQSADPGPGGRGWGLVLHICTEYVNIMYIVYTVVTEDILCRCGSFGDRSEE